MRSISVLTGLDFSHLRPWDPLDELAPEAAPLDEPVRLPAPVSDRGTYADLQL
ncbi:hypothetical protein [Nocardioides endophyticus]|uniref:hypothetical protein n=1 Tax=Nocardioides endophyticus TaxID=1353775 RepID=UPI0031E7C0D4